MGVGATMAGALKPDDFIDAATFGLDWKGRYVRLGVGITARVDNKNNRVSLPAGAIGYVASATSGSVLVVFDRDPRKVPEPTSAGQTVASPRYGAVFSFGFDDWLRLKLTRSK
jgi:hypothetical protein